MEPLALMVGIGIVAFGVLYFSFQWDKNEHIFLRIIGSFVFITLLFLIPKAAHDYRQPCDLVVNRTTESYVYGDNYTDYHWDYSDPATPNPADKLVNLFHKNTTYTYDYVCYDEDNTTVLTFYRAYTTFSIIFVTYFFIYLIYTFFIKKGGMIDKFMKRVNRR